MILAEELNPGPYGKEFLRGIKLFLYMLCALLSSSLFYKDANMADVSVE